MVKFSSAGLGTKGGCDKEINLFVSEICNIIGGTRSINKVSGSAERRMQAVGTAASHSGD